MKQDKTKNHNYFINFTGNKNPRIMTFILHSQLAADTMPVGKGPLCHVLLMNNRDFPWLILVPNLENAVELTDLSEADYTVVMGEIRQAAQALQAVFQPYKLNIAALGNMVRQLHIHVIARFEGDAAWPNPVWGSKSEPYTAEAAAERVLLLQKVLFK